MLPRPEVPMDAREARCMLLAKVLAADGIMTDHERAFLEDAMETYELDDAARGRVRNLDGWDEAEQIVSALDMAARRELMDSLVSAALADGKLSAHETAAIDKLAKALGLS
jgi:uncharacterized tellurite resistance protein B-like protein